MSKSRLELHELLVNILGSRYVYYQPPENFKLKYPCIVYERSDIRTVNADNKKYATHKKYSVTVIDKNPDSDVPDKILELPYSSFDRHFVYDNLNHDVLTVFY